MLWLEAPAYDKAVFRAYFRAIQLWRGLSPTNEGVRSPKASEI